MKTRITALIGLFFVVNYNVYLYVTSIHRFNNAQIPPIWSYLIIGITIWAIWIIEAEGIDTFLQESIINGMKFLLGLIWLDILLTKMGLIKDPYTNLIIFLSGSSLSFGILLYEMLPNLTKKWTKLIMLITLLLGISFFLFQAFVGYLTSR